MSGSYSAFFDDPANPPRWPGPEEAKARISVSAQRKAKAKAAKKREKAIRRAYVKRVGNEDQTVTPQTRARHRKTSFTRMIERKEIDGSMFQAAQEIDRVYTALTGMLVVGGGSMEPRSRGHATAMPEAIATAHAKRYKPWADLMSAWRKRGGPAALEITIDVVVDGRALATIDREREWRNGTAKEVVRIALRKYAVMAHWAPASDMRRAA